MVGLTRISNHLHMEDYVDDIDCFPVLTEEGLLSVEDKLAADKVFQVQVVIYLFTYLLFWMDCGFF